LGGGIWKTVKNKENGTDLIQELSEYGWDGSNSADFKVTGGNLSVQGNSKRR
jgi:hypothetical protein